MQEPDVDLSFKEQLQNRKTYLKKQKKLLDTVLYWYVLPPFIFNIVMIFGVGDVSGYDHWAVELLPDLLREKIMTTVFLLAFFGYVVWLNKQAAKKEYQPVIDEIERMQKQLEEE